MRAIMVAVDYTDLLAITLPYNAHHFEEVWIVTDNESDNAVLEIARNVAPLVPDTQIAVLATDLFYRDGAEFNKWRALEWGLDQMGRYGWLCLMDADVLWPKDMRWEESVCSCHGLPDLSLHQGQFMAGLHFGYLYSPLRRMWDNWPAVPPMMWATNTNPQIPLEDQWSKFPLHRNTGEWAGYSQIFHASDPVLGPAPWHETDWRHAGGADSLFQEKWPRECKVRPPFEVLHLGPAGKNWYGRATSYLDGSTPVEAQERLVKVKQIWEERARRDKAWRGKFRGDKVARDHIFGAEKLGAENQE